MQICRGPSTRPWLPAAALAMCCSAALPNRRVGTEAAAHGQQLPAARSSELLLMAHRPSDSNTTALS